MAHHHHHAHGDSYFLDQSCLVALSAAFGGICLSLCTWQNSMLHLMLAPFLHSYVLAGGILLIGAALVRAALLLRAAVKDARNEHQHADCDHENACDHAHHDHDWAPWRYVVVLVPIVLFLLGLPNKMPELRADPFSVDMTQEAMGYAGLVATSERPLAGAVAIGALQVESAIEPAPTVPLSALEKATLGLAQQWQGELVRIEGRYQATDNPRQFLVERYYRRCCSHDAVPVRIPIVCKLPAPLFAPKQWLAVTGRVSFRNSPNGMVTVLEVANQKAIVPIPEQSIFEH